MAKKRNLGPVSKEEEDEESWMITYADAVTLLLCFFVTLTAISKIDVPIFEDIRAGIASELGKRKIETPPVAQLEATISQILDNNGISREVGLTRDKDNVYLEFRGRQLFGNGNARLADGAQIVLEEVGINLLRGNFANFKVAVESHANRDGSLGRFNSQWELTSARSAAVAQFLEEIGVDQTRILATGFGSGDPKIEDVRDDEGRLIGEELEASDSERIVMRIHPIKETDKPYSFTPDTAPTAPDLSQ